jgi:hypothetical protein
MAIDVHMKILPPAQEKMMRAIRDAIALDPLISIRSLQEVLERRSIKIASREYLTKLVWKLNRELSVNVDRQKLSERIAQMKERQRIVVDRLIRIAFYTDDLKKEGLPPPSYRDQISALNAIMKLDLAIINAEMDAGIFERHFGTLEIERRNKPIPKEVRERIRQAFINWGMIQKETIAENNADQPTNTSTAIMVRPQ